MIWYDMIWNNIEIETCKGSIVLCLLEVFILFWKKTFPLWTDGLIIIFPPSSFNYLRASTSTSLGHADIPLAFSVKCWPGIARGVPDHAQSFIDCYLPEYLMIMGQPAARYAFIKWVQVGYRVQFVQTASYVNYGWYP
jgi:hypothetical protein